MTVGSAEPRFRKGFFIGRPVEKSTLNTAKCYIDVMAVRKLSTKLVVSD